jgi:hypothetical protein
MEFSLIRIGRLRSLTMGASELLNVQSLRRGNHSDGIPRVCKSICYESLAAGWTLHVQEKRLSRAHLLLSLKLNSILRYIRVLSQLM